MNYYYWLDGSAYCPKCVECDTPAIDANDPDVIRETADHCSCCGESEAPAPVDVEVATCIETVRECGGISEFAGLEHYAIDVAVDAYLNAATNVLLAYQDGGSRLHWSHPRGSRRLHSQWCGTKWGYSAGAIGTTASDLTSEEKQIIDSAHDAGLKAARRAIEIADDDAR